MKKLVFILLSFLLMNCAPQAVYNPPAKINKARYCIMNASYDETWTATVRAFAKRNWSIRNMEKVSGYISADWTNWDVPEARYFMEFGTQEFEPSMMGYSIYIDNIELKYNFVDS